MTKKYNIYKYNNETEVKNIIMTKKYNDENKVK